MTKTKTTKRALVSSVLALFLCFTMLLGTTYAWFTDSVTSAGNKITSGTLKVDLELLNKTTGEWSSIKDNQEPLFNYDKWEPGYTEAKILKIENEGTLALKWKAAFVSANTLSALADVIDVYVCYADTELGYPADRTLEGYTKYGTVAEFMNGIEEELNGELEAEEVTYVGIVFKMQESAGNDYQDMELGAFDIKILATQLASEEDAFGSDYDAEAKYPLVPKNVATVEDLTTVLADGGYAVMSNDAELTSTLVMNGGVLDGNGNEIKKETENKTGILDATGGTVQDVDLTGVEVTKTLGRKEYSYVPDIAITSTNGLSADLSIDEVVISGTPYAIGLDANGNAVYATDSTFTNNVNLWNQSEAFFEGCTFTVDEQANTNGFAWIGLGGNMTFTNCHFDECIDFYVNISGCSGTITFTNCTFGDSKVPVEATVDFFVNNFEYSVELYEGAFGDGDPGRTNFTFIVDGTTVWEATN